MYSLEFSKRFEKKYKKLIKKNAVLEKRALKALGFLRKNPRHNSLKTHRVYSLAVGLAWSSRVVGDVRIIWNYKKNKLRILSILDIGGHSGKKRVYVKSR